MQAAAPRPQQAAIRTDLGAIFVSLELSRSAWLVTSVSPGGSEKMSKHQVCGGDVAGLLTRFAELQAKARQVRSAVSVDRRSGGRARRFLAPPCAAERGH